MTRAELLALSHSPRAVANASFSRTLRRLWQAGLVELWDDGRRSLSEQHHWTEATAEKWAQSWATLHGRTAHPDRRRAVVERHSPQLRVSYVGLTPKGHAFLASVKSSPSAS